jgi:hypothetical protein
MYGVISEHQPDSRTIAYWPDRTGKKASANHRAKAGAFKRWEDGRKVKA